ncbi:MAG: hypothetical protein ABJC51_06885, partial [Acidobacteriota bacterium]
MSRAAVSAFRAASSFPCGAGVCGVWPAADAVCPAPCGAAAASGLAEVAAAVVPAGVLGVEDALALDAGAAVALLVGAPLGVAADAVAEPDGAAVVAPDFAVA